MQKEKSSIRLISDVESWLVKLMQINSSARYLCSQLNIIILGQKFKLTFPQILIPVSRRVFCSELRSEVCNFKIGLLLF